MATYSTGMGANGKPKHLPLKHAIETHNDDALLILLSTVYKAGENSRLVNQGKLERVSRGVYRWVRNRSG